MNPLPQASHHLGLILGIVFSLDFLLLQPYSSDYVDLSEYQNLLNPSPESHLLLNLVPWIWSAVGRHTWYPSDYSNCNFKSPMIWLECYRSRTTRPLSAFLFWGGWNELTVLNGPTVILMGSRSLCIFQNKGSMESPDCFSKYSSLCTPLAISAGKDASLLS